MPTMSSIGPCRFRRLLAAVLLAFALGEASAQTVRLALILSPMAGRSGAPAPLQPAAQPIMSPSPVASLLVPTPAVLPVSVVPVALSATSVLLAVQSPRGAQAPVQEGEWRRFFDGGLQVSRGVLGPSTPSAGDRGRGLASSSLPRAARPARPAPALIIQPSPAPQARATWMKRIGSRAFWMAVAIIVPGGFLVLGIYWSYRAIAAYLRRRR